MWLEIVTDVKILDLSVAMETDHYSVWAVSCNGDVLFRNGITSSLPQVRCVFMLRIHEIQVDLVGSGLINISCDFS